VRKALDIVRKFEMIAPEQSKKIKEQEFAARGGGGASYSANQPNNPMFAAS
jgi:hypothetical protein